MLLTLNMSKNVGYFVDFGQVSSHFTGTKILSLILLTTTQLCHLWLPTSHCAVPVWLMGPYATPLVTSYFSPNPVTMIATDLRERFLPYIPSCFFQGFPGSWQFNLKVSRASCWSSKHSLNPAICLNHSNPQKFYTGKFYLRDRAGRLIIIICFVQDSNTFYNRWMCQKPHALSVWPQIHAV